MKYALTHCYTDQNKGDAAIIIATTQLLRKLDSNAKITMFSTFGPNDEKFKNEHEFVGKYGDALFPGMFYQPEPIIGKNDFSRVFHFMWITLKFLVLLITQNSMVTSLFFTKLERQGISDFLQSDIVISKGGSYITTQNNSARQCLSLITMLYPFFLAKRYRKKMVIFSQSLGPVSGRFNKWLMHKALSRISKIFLRENVCLNEYSEIKELEKTVDISIIPDSAFYLKSEKKLSKHSVKLDSKKFNVGFTIVDHAFKYIENELDKEAKIVAYKNSLIETIKYLIAEHDANIHIFPQVIVANSHLGHNDVKISREIEQVFADLGLGERVKYHYGDFNPMQLKDMYSLMDIFVGTRLHSVIFSLSNNVPSINIAYHGTKSQGILKSVAGFEKNVISINEISPSSLIEMVTLLIQTRVLAVETLKSENVRMNHELEAAMMEVIEMGSTH